MLLNFKSFINEALELKQAKAIVRSSAGLYKTLYPQIFENKHRLYYDIDINTKQNLVDELKNKNIHDIQSLIDNYDYEDDYGNSPFDICYTIIEFFNDYYSNKLYKELIASLKKSLIVIRDKFGKNELYEKKEKELEIIIDGIATFICKDYLAGIVEFVVYEGDFDTNIVFRKQYKIGGLLDSYKGDAAKVKKAKGLLDKFKMDSIRMPAKSYKIVISRHPYDIAGMSTGRGWTSCMNLKDGCNKHHVWSELRQGSLVAYLIKDTDLNIKDPVSRILLKPYLNHETGAIALNLQAKTYSKAGYSSLNTEFESKLYDITDNLNSLILGKGKGGRFDFFGSYDDDDDEYIMIINSKKDLIDDINSSPNKYNLIPFILNDLSESTLSETYLKNSSEYNKCNNNLIRFSNEFTQNDIDDVLNKVANRSTTYIYGTLNELASTKNKDLFSKYGKRLFLNAMEIFKKNNRPIDLRNGFRDYKQIINDKVLNYYDKRVPITTDKDEWRESKSVDKKIFKNLGMSEEDLALLIDKKKKIKGGLVKNINKLIELKENPLNPKISDFLIKKSKDNSISEYTRKVYSALHKKGTTDKARKYKVEITGFPHNTDYNIVYDDVKSSTSNSDEFKVGDTIRLLDGQEVTIDSEEEDYYIVELEDGSLQIAYPFEFVKKVDENVEYFYRIPKTKFDRLLTLID